MLSFKPKEMDFLYKISILTSKAMYLQSSIHLEQNPAEASSKTFHCVPVKSIICCSFIKCVTCLNKVSWLESLSSLFFFCRFIPCCILPSCYEKSSINRTVIIVAFDISKSIFAPLKISKFNSRSLCFFILLTFHFPTQQRSILFKDRTKNHLRYIFTSLRRCENLTCVNNI